MVAFAYEEFVLALNYLAMFHPLNRTSVKNIISININLYLNFVITFYIKNIYYVSYFDIKKIYNLKV